VPQKLCSRRFFYKIGYDLIEGYITHNAVLTF
jgi:hypothetical protein